MKKSSITNLRRISKPGSRIYSTHKDIPRVLNGMGIVIISTSQGILTDREGTNERFRRRTPLFHLVTKEHFL